MKKICMVVPSFTAKGGISTVVSGYKNSKLEEKYEIKYIESYCDGGKISKICKAIKAYIAFGKELICNRPDLVHIHSSFGGSFYRKLPFIYMASAFHIPIVNHIHGSAISDLYINAGKKKKKLVENTFNKCTYLVVLSEEWKENISVIKTTTPKTVIENYSTIHRECFKKKNNKRKRILYLGFITQLKGCFDMPEIAQKVIKEYDNVEFIVAGSGEIEKLKEQLEKKGIEKYFSFPGWVNNDEKKKLLEESDMFFLPSYTEAMPMSILESMGYGLPVVASNVGGIPQLVKEGINGFMAEPGDTDAFTRKIIVLLQDDECCYKMGKSSLDIAEERYSLEKHIDKICSVYESIL